MSRSYKNKRRDTTFYKLKEEETWTSMDKYEDYYRQTSYKEVRAKLKNDNRSFVSNSYLKRNSKYW